MRVPSPVRLFRESSYHPTCFQLYQYAFHIRLCTVFSLPLSVHVGVSALTFPHLPDPVPSPSFVPPLPVLAQTFVPPLPVPAPPDAVPFPSFVPLPVPVPSLVQRRYPFRFVQLAIDSVVACFHFLPLLSVGVIPLFLPQLQRRAGQQPAVLLLLAHFGFGFPCPVAREP